jgi:hypothetical protein
MVIIWGTSWEYFVRGIGNPSIWGEFLWTLSFQDGLVGIASPCSWLKTDFDMQIPLMAFTAQAFFGKRAWLLLGRRVWIGWVAVLLPTITLACGIG